jgi:SAM-dependent methyltransferase
VAVTDRALAYRTSYDRVADRYAATFADELAHKPLDRALLACFAELVRGRGHVADIGCGPGHVAGYLRDLGLSVLGIDLSPGMVAQARRLVTGVEFREGDMSALDVEDCSWGGIVAFYSVIHLTPEAVPSALREFHRALMPGGLLLLAFHVGEETRHLDEWWGERVDLDFHFFRTAALEDQLAAAGFAVEARVEREPYAPAEVATRRGYLLARKPESGAGVVSAETSPA